MADLPTFFIMTITKKMLLTLLAIVTGGIICATVYHGIQACVFGRGYPYSTFLFRPDVRFTDFTDTLEPAKAFDPYSHGANYFPLTYVLLYPISLVPWQWSMVVLFGLSLTTIFIWIRRELLEAVPESPWLATLTATVLLGISYPSLLCLERGNIEYLLLALVVGFLAAYHRGRHCLAITCLVPAICVKLYPAALLALYLRPRRWRYIAVAGGVSFMLSLASLASFKHSIREDYALFQEGMLNYRNTYLIGDYAMSGSASAWGLCKVIDRNIELFRAARDHRPPAINRPQKSLRVLRMLNCFNGIALILCIAVAAYVALVERDPHRQITLLLLFMTMSSPGGTDYRLLYVIVAVVSLLAAASRRPRDFLILILLSIVLIPNKYVYLPGIMSDSCCEDVSLQILINPLVLLFAFGLLCADGWAARATPSEAKLGPA
jgi:Glycosyltransferase family 87